VFGAQVHSNLVLIRQLDHNSVMRKFIAAEESAEAELLETTVWWSALH